MMFEPAPRHDSPERLEQVHDDALFYVNKALTACSAEKLDKMPKGEPMNECWCPVAEALRPIGCDEVHPSGAMFRTSPDNGKKVAVVWKQQASASGHPYVMVHMPIALIEFMEDFDNGRFPELIEVRQ